MSEDTTLWRPFVPEDASIFSLVDDDDFEDLPHLEWIRDLQRIRSVERRIDAIVARVLYRGEDYDAALVGDGDG